MLGDVCAGDVGGSVWKKLKFNGDTYAVLTGKKYLGDMCKLEILEVAYGKD